MLFLVILFYFELVTFCHFTFLDIIKLYAVFLVVLLSAELIFQNCCRLYFSSHNITGWDFWSENRFKLSEIASFVELLLKYMFCEDYTLNLIDKLYVQTFVVLCIGGGLMRYYGLYLSVKKQREMGTKTNLIQESIYKFERNPEYFGWFCFVVTTKMIVFNYCSTLLTAAILWRTLSEKILDKEFTLFFRFRDSYIQYWKSCRTWVPYIDQILELNFRIQGMILRKQRRSFGLHIEALQYL